MVTGRVRLELEEVAVEVLRAGTKLQAAILEAPREVTTYSQRFLGPDLCLTRLRCNPIATDSVDVGRRDPSLKPNDAATKDPAGDAKQPSRKLIHLRFRSCTVCGGARLFSEVARKRSSQDLREGLAPLLRSFLGSLPDLVADPERMQ
jgi:hypothetical protein